MAVKIFLLGRPGSGKSTVYRYVARYVEQKYQGWSVVQYNDYAILQEMFRFEQQNHTENIRRKFLPTDHGGFDVIDFSVLDNVLKELERRVRKRYQLSNDELIIIEFARDDYKRALQHFSPSFLKDAYYLFIEEDLETCIQRIKARVTDPPTPDNHFVSTEIMTKYYANESPPINFTTAFHIKIDKKRVKTISSRGSLEAFNAKIEKYIRMILARESPFYLSMIKKLNLRCQF